MANVTFGAGFDIVNPPWWTVFTAQGGPTWVMIEDAAKRQWFSGTFKFDSKLKVSGTADGISLGPVSGGDWYRITDAGYDAAKLQSLIITGTPTAFYAYVLAGNDRVSSDGAARIWGLGGNDTLTGDGTVDGGEGSDWFDPRAGFGVTMNLQTGKVTGKDLPGITLVSIENLRGGTANDTLVGNAGLNQLDGGAGFDVVASGAAKGAFVVDLLARTASNGGTVDRLTSIEGAIGGSAADRLSGNGAANLLDGGAGADTLTGGAGNDTFGVDQAGDRIVEVAGGGFDTVRAPFDTTLGANLENLTLTGATAVKGTGNAAPNVITGNARANQLLGVDGNDTLVGGAGADSLAGGAGNDRLDGGTDNDTLDGGLGADTLTGGTGNDTYLVNNAGDAVTTDTGGSDVVLASVSWRLGEFTSGIDTIRATGTAAVNITGNGEFNRIEGNAAANELDGYYGEDTLVGGAGNDRYLVDETFDQCVEVAGGGTDTVVLVRDAMRELPGSYTLPDQVENLEVRDAGVVSLYGNGLANQLRGNASVNWLNGLAGADTMTGGGGNDVYFVDAPGDKVVEVSGGGRDTVVAQTDYVLAAYVEDLAADENGLSYDLGFSLTGNGLANRITANNGGCRLDGGAGADTLVGGLGADTFVVSGDGDVIVPGYGGGADTVISSANWTLGQYLTHLSLAGSADLNGAGNERDNLILGNAGANQLSGNAGNDTLDGGAGADTLDGGEGDDVLYVDDAADVIVGGDIYDLVHATTSYVVPDGVAWMYLDGEGDIDATGNGLGNRIAGNSGNNVLDGGGGVDTLLGGAGNDVYVLDSPSEYVRERAGEGEDTVVASVGVYVGGEAIEVIVLTGTADVGVVANGLDNRIAGNAGDNWMDASAGRDVVVYADATAGVVVDLGAGIATGFGNDTLLGFEDVVGSAFDDTLRGDSGSNALTGGEGADVFVIDGGAADTVVDFGSGVDRFAVFQPSIAIGNGDAVVDGATVTAGPGGFTAEAELVIASAPAGDVQDAAAVAALFGAASSAYATGRTAVFVVAGADAAAVYRFTSAGDDADVSAGELQLLAVLAGAALPATADFAWLA